MKAPRNDDALLLEMMGEASLIIDSGRTLIAANTRAIQLLASGSALRVERGTLCATRDADQLGLLRGLRIVCGTGGPAAVKALQLRNDRGSREVVFLTRWYVPRAGDEVLVVCHDPKALERDAAHRARVLSESFALTPSEASIATAIWGGLTAKEIATAKATSVATVRTQLQRALQKTSLSRQADLTRLVAAIPSLAPHLHPHANSATSADTSLQSSP